MGSCGRGVLWAYVVVVVVSYGEVVARGGLGGVGDGLDVGGLAIALEESVVGSEVAGPHPVAIGGERGARW